MTFRLVLVERVHTDRDQVLSNSGILICEKFVMVTSNLFMDEVKSIDWKSDRIADGRLHSEIFKKSNPEVNVVWKNGERYVNKKAKARWMFSSDSVRNSDRSIFRNWAIDTVDNNTDILEVLSVFFVLVLDGDDCGVSEIETVFKKWWQQIVLLTVRKGDSVRISSAPFGSRLLLHSFSKGIVSNVFGCDSAILISDCPTTPGSEGSPVYLEKSSNPDIPFGMVLTSANWWRGEWLGITVLVDIKTILFELLQDLIISEHNGNNVSDGLPVTTSVELSLVQIYSGSSWGTGILLNEDKGLFVTNSHVLTDDCITLHYKENVFKATLVFKTPEDEIYDLAILQREEIVTKTDVRAIDFAETAAKLGDTVYAAGFSIFSKNAKPTPMLTRGCVSGVNTYMLRTTCCVHAGASGGAVLDEYGHLLGVIVCNVRINETNAVFARVNMAVPTEVFRNVVTGYMMTNDLTILNELHTRNEEARITWKRIESKL